MHLKAIKHIHKTSEITKCGICEKNYDTFSFIEHNNEGLQKRDFSRSLF